MIVNRISEIKSLKEEIELRCSQYDAIPIEIAQAWADELTFTLDLIYSDERVMAMLKGKHDVE